MHHDVLFTQLVPCKRPGLGVFMQRNRDRFEILTVDTAVRLRLAIFGPQSKQTDPNILVAKTFLRNNALGLRFRDQ